MDKLQIGIIGTAHTEVAKNNTAKTMKSGALSVFATPSMVALMEEASFAAVNDKLDNGMGTVGISLNITHDAPSAIGAKITATSELVAIDGRKLTFKISAVEETINGNKVIGKGTHERFIINNEKFMSKLNK